jgi:hypothetical protein
MELNYTKLAVLLLRVQGVIMIASSIISIVSMLSIALSTPEFSKPMRLFSLVGPALGQPIIGLLLIHFSVPLGRWVTGIFQRE